MNRFKAKLNGFAIIEQRNYHMNMNNMHTVYCYCQYIVTLRTVLHQLGIPNFLVKRDMSFEYE